MLEFDSKKGPLYIQLAKYLVSQILKKKILPGNKLPSARALAVTVGLNANTIIQAFQELERIGITEKQRGKGTFVRQDVKINLLRMHKMSKLTETYMAEVDALGFRKEDAIGIIGAK